MSNFLDQFRVKVLRSVWKRADASEPAAVELNDKIALGVLLRVVAEADQKFLPEEKQMIKDVLMSYGHISTEELPVVFQSIESATEERIDLYVFAREVSRDLPYTVKRGIVENLFRVACADQDLAHQEEETIRKVSGLLGIDHKDFISAKIKVKKEFGMETVG